MSTDEQAAREWATERGTDYTKHREPDPKGWEGILGINPADLRAAFLAGVAHGRARQREEDAALADIEPELPGEMPDEMWEAIQGDRDAVGEALRIAVRQTKQNIATAVRATGNTEEE